MGRRRSTGFRVTTAIASLVGLFAADAMAQPTVNGGRRLTAEERLEEELNRRGGTPVWADGPKGHERPVIRTEPETIRNHGRRDARGSWSWNSDPVLGTDAIGRTYDKRTGGLLQPHDRRRREKIAEARLRDGLYDDRTRFPVELIAVGDGGATGFTGAGFENGRRTLASGRAGEVYADVDRVEGYYTAGLHAGRNGIGGRAGVQGEAVAVGLQAVSTRLEVGDARAHANVYGRAKAFLGADGRAELQATINTRRVNFVAEAGAFVGAKARGEVVGSAKFLGIGVRTTLAAEASFGLGAEARGYFRVDWSTMTVRIGGKAAATFGGGLGAGAMVEISAADAVKGVASAIGRGWNWLSGVWNRRPAERPAVPLPPIAAAVATGSNVRRNAPTVLRIPPTDAPSGARTGGAGSGIGVRR